MISTSSILSTGEKKWMPMKFSGRVEASARPVIGRVEVFDAKMTSGRFSTASAFLVDVGLDARVLEHRLDHQVGVGQIGVVAVVVLSRLALPARARACSTRRRAS